MPRLYCPLPLSEGAVLALPEAAARHVQVLRLQPGDGVTLFDGRGGEWSGRVQRMGRSDVQVSVGTHSAIEREPRVQVHLAAALTANDRMDWLVEKAAELGAASLQPLLTERSVVRLAGERAARRVAHWQAVAAAACEQCGRNRVPSIHPVADLATWAAPAGPARLLLSLEMDAMPVATQEATSVLVLSGPEGGLSPREEAAALAAGFTRVSLGPRVLRAETAPLAALAVLTIRGDA